MCAVGTRSRGALMSQRTPVRTKAVSPGWGRPAWVALWGRGVARAGPPGACPRTYASRSASSGAGNGKGTRARLTRAPANSCRDEGGAWLHGAVWSAGTAVPAGPAGRETGTRGPTDTLTSARVSDDSQGAPSPGPVLDLSLPDGTRLKGTSSTVAPREKSVSKGWPSRPGP